MAVAKTWLVGIFSKNGIGAPPSPFKDGTRTLNGLWLHEFQSKEQAEEFWCDAGQRESQAGGKALCSDEHLCG